ncbi:MAG: BrnT family toxin [Acidobacteriota bacterium]|nr:BrnT family toxin [Acidobacteriota bacterium]
MEFEWDENKNIENIKNHDGISFEKAVKVFDDDLAIPLEDPEHSDDNETRYALIGMCELGLVFVSFTFRGENFQIISARKASWKMEKMYADND